MESAPIPADEQKRQAALDNMHIIGTADEERFDRLTREAAEKLQAPISTISIIDHDREWFKSRSGVERHELPRATSFCGHTIVRGKMFVVEDTEEDPRFQDNPQVKEPPHVRFYAGITLHDTKTHQPIGAFCIKDTKPRSLSMDELNTLMEYAHQAEIELNKPVSPATPQDEQAQTQHDTQKEDGVTPLWRHLVGDSRFTSC